MKTSHTSGELKKKEKKRGGGGSTNRVPMLYIYIYFAFPILRPTPLIIINGMNMSLISGPSREILQGGTRLFWDPVDRLGLLSKLRI